MEVEEKEESSEEVQDVKDEQEESSDDEETEEGEEVVVDEEGNEEEVEEEEEEQSVPYARFKEVTEQNAILKKLSDTLATRQPSTPAQQRQAVDNLAKIQDPEVREAIAAELRQKEEGFTGILGQLADKLDEANARIAIPNYGKVKNHIEELKNEWANRGQYLKREDAYAILKSQGIIKDTPKSATSKPKTVIQKQKVRVVTEKSGVDNRQPTKKAFKELSLPEKEKALENVKF